MADKYMTLVSGRETLISGTVQSTGTSNGGNIVALDTSGRIDLPVGVGPDVFTATASEALSAGNYVNVYANAGVINVRKADNSNDRQALGFVMSSVTSGSMATVFLGASPNTAQTGLTLGVRYYLGTGGAATATIPTSAGGALILQYLGDSISASTINTDIEDAIVL